MLTGAERPCQYAGPAGWNGETGRSTLSATNSPLNAQDAYAFWVAGFVLLAIVVVRGVRQHPPPLRLPRPTGAQMSTILAWLIIAAVIVVVLLTHRG